jgi:hypothetical protein
MPGAPWQEAPARTIRDRALDFASATAFLAEFQPMIDMALARRLN